MTHPLLDAAIELDCALREALLGVRSFSVRQRVADAAREVRSEILALQTGVPRVIDAELVKAFLEEARRQQVPWPTIADTVRALQGDDGR